MYWVLYYGITLLISIILSKRLINKKLIVKLNLFYQSIFFVLLIITFGGDYFSFLNSYVRILLINNTKVIVFTYLASKFRSYNLIKSINIY